MTRYELINALASVCKTMEEKGITPSDYKYIGLYGDYMRMKAEGHKITFIVYWLHEQYDCSERTVLRVVKRFGEIV